MFLAATLALILHGLFFCIRGDWLKTGSTYIMNTPVSVTLTYQLAEKIPVQAPVPEPPAKRSGLQNKKNITPKKIITPRISESIQEPAQPKAISEVAKDLPKIIESVQAEPVSEPTIEPAPAEAAPDMAGAFENENLVDKAHVPEVVDRELSDPQEKMITDIDINPDPIDSSYKEVVVIKEAIPEYKLNPAPDYPRVAQRRGYEGTVFVEVFVDTRGQVKDFRLAESSGYSLLDKAALVSVKKWIFEPGMRGDKKIEMWVIVPVRFKLE
jgi:protein TonB